MNKPLSFALFGMGGSATILIVGALQSWANVMPSFLCDIAAGKAAWLLLMGVVALVLAWVTPARLQPLTIT